ncbi:MAG: hypothetical protein NZ952_05210 [Candidatus Bathyarchaeota archaeon]|nr:hypothetical protein [Candidatus Bathyarchaeota archaeon]
MSEEVELKSGLTPKAVVTGVVLVALLAAWSTLFTYTYPMNTYLQPYLPADRVNMSIYWMFWAGALFTFFCPLLVFVLLPEKMRFTRQELSVIFAMVIVVYPLTVKTGNMMALPSIALSGAPWLDGDYPERNFWIMPWHCPAWKRLPDGTWEYQYVNGGPVGRPLNVAVPVRWDLYFPGYVFGFFELGLLLIMGFCVAALIRKQYIEVEALPFPNAAAATCLINEATTLPEGKAGFLGTKPKLLSNKWLWIGFLVAQGLMIPAWLGLILPRMGISATAYQFYATSANQIIPYIPVRIVFTAPWILGLGLLLPLDVLISHQITWIVFVVIIANLQWIVGFYGPPPATATMFWYIRQVEQNLLIRVSPGGQGLNAWAVGILIVGAIYPMWVHRRHVKSVIMSIFKPQPELERGDIKYRWYWLGLILSFIGYVLLFAIPEYRGYNIRPFLWITALFLIFTLIMWLGEARLRAETGAVGGFVSYVVLYYFSPRFWGPRALMAQLMGYPDVAGNASGRNMIYYWTFQSTHGMFCNQNSPIGIPIANMLEGFKVGHEAKVRPVDLLIAAIIGIVVAYWVCNPLWSWLLCTANWQGQQGLAEEHIRHDWHTSYTASRGAPIGWRGYWYMGYGDPWPDVTNITYQYIIGGAVGLICFILRAKFPAFIYNPWTIVLWGVCRGNIHDAWFFFLVALIVKFIVIRVWGVTFYEKSLVPLSVGLIVGGALIFPINEIIYWFTGRIVAT